MGRTAHFQISTRLFYFRINLLISPMYEDQEK